MVVKRTMTIDQFLLGAHLVTQQQQTQGRNQPPSATHTHKRQRTANQPSRLSEDALQGLLRFLHWMAWSFRSPLVAPAQLCRLGLMWHLFLLALLWDGRQSLGSRTSLSRWRPVLEIGLKVSVVRLPDVRGKSFNFPKTCTFSLVAMTNP